MVDGMGLINPLMPNGDFCTLYLIYSFQEANVTKSQPF